MVLIVRADALDQNPPLAIPSSAVTLLTRALYKTGFAASSKLEVRFVGC